MAHFGVLCTHFTGPLNAMLSLANELVRRGNRVTLFSLADARASAEAAQVAFQPLGEREFPSGTDRVIAEKFGSLGSLATLQFTLGHLSRVMSAFLRDGPEALRAAQLDALIVNGASFEGGTLAEHVGIPFFTVSSAIVLNEEPDIPPVFTPWSYRPVWWGRLRNVLTHAAVTGIATRELWATVDAQRERWGLPLCRTRNDRLSPLVQISQAPPEFEYPRRQAPACLHFVGPLHTPSGRAAVDFPFERLSGKPLIYVSMGTLVNRISHVFPGIAEACQALDAQLVISLGGAADPATQPRLPGDPLVVRFAPQLEILSRAHMMLTHAGMNSTMECVQRAVPMVAIPIANDAPGIAARIAWTGVGELVPLRAVGTARLRRAIERVFREPSYRRHAARLQAACRRAGGVQRAADILERAVATGRPVPVAPENRPITPESFGASPTAAPPP